MTRVDFYIITKNNPRNQETIACQLVEKAFKQGYRILILGHTSKQLVNLDEKLWTYNEQGFIPHEFLPEGSNTLEHLKIILSTNEQANPGANLLINLSGKIPDSASSFERIAEIVPARDQDRKQSRSRYKEYRTMNFELETHDL